MAKIFLTGMSAHQASEKSNSRSLNFAGVLYKVLTEAGHSVTWADPNLSLSKEDFSNYDSILIGISPLTSITANRVYGALKLINTLAGDERLTLFIDSPNTKQISIGLNATVSNLAQLTKSFYSYRKDYKTVVSNPAEREAVVAGLTRLHEEPWPTTIFPGLPWKEAYEVARNLPENIGESLVSVNLDSHLLDEEAYSGQKLDRWAHDQTGSTAEKKLLKTLLLPTEKILSGRAYGDSTALFQLHDCHLALIGPVKNDGSWWTYKYIQALNAGSVIYTDWKETHILGNSWSHLPNVIELMPYSEKRELAAEQRAAYKNAIPEKGVALRSLEIALGIFKGKET